MQHSNLDLKAIAEAETRYEIRLYAKRDIALVRGEGVYLWDSDGKRYLDMMSNYGVAILGHAHPAVTRAISEQAERLLSCHQSFFNDVRAHLLSMLSTLLPDSLQHVSFANSGAEAVEAALKFARASTGRTRIVSAKRAYHGRTMGALSVTGEQKHRAPFEPLIDDCQQVAFGDLEGARACLDGAAAIILEPVQGESGVRPASSEYLQGIRELCSETGALLILDEVQTAFRTGRTWAFQHHDILPDVMALSKSLANGLPIGLTVASRAVAQRIPSGSHGSTFGGGPLVCAAAAATLSVAGSPDFNLHVQQSGAAFLERLRQIRSSLIREVRGAGLMVAVELKRNVSSVLQRMQDEGVLAIPAGSTSIRFLPPLIVEQQHLSTAADVLEYALQRAGE